MWLYGIKNVTQEEKMNTTSKLDKIISLFKLKSSLRRQNSVNKNTYPIKKKVKIIFIWKKLNPKKQIYIQQ